jgi:hypothetical protein
MFKPKISLYSGSLQAIRMNDTIENNQSMSYGQDDGGSSSDAIDTVTASLTNLISKAGDVASAFFKQPSTSSDLEKLKAAIAAQEAAKNQSAFGNMVPYMLVGAAGIALIMVLKSSKSKKEID